MWMNEMDVEEAEDRYRGPDEPVMGPATRTLAGLVRAVNDCSDGWAYWRSPGRAAQQLMDLITAHQRWERTEYRHPRQGAEATPDKLSRAYTQLRRFRTSRKVEFRLYPADGVTNADPKAADLPPVPDLATAARAALPALELLGDYIGNTFPGKAPAYPAFDRCQIILDLKRALGDVEDND